MPRVSASISSVFMRTVARPRSLANLLARGFALGRAARRAMSPLLRRSKVTAAPGLRPRQSRIFLGTLTWPLLVRFVAIKSYLAFAATTLAHCPPRTQSQRHRYRDYSNRSSGHRPRLAGFQAPAGRPGDR